MRFWYSNFWKKKSLPWEGGVPPPTPSPRSVASLPRMGPIIPPPNGENKSTPMVMGSHHCGSTASQKKSHGSSECSYANWCAYHPEGLASTRASTKLGRVAEANDVISAFFPRQTRKSVRILVSWDMTTNLQRIDCRHTWDCPRNQSGRAPNAAENPDRSRTARTHQGSHQEVLNHGLGQSGF